MIGSWQCLDPNGDFGGAHCGNRGRDKQVQRVRYARRAA
jgi:hypothetical protein